MKCNLHFGAEKNITLFTCALLENNQTQCYPIANDSKDKSKLSLATFILKPLEIIKFRASKPKSTI